MNELLKKILESDLLTEETKAEITESFQDLVEAEIAAARSDAQATVRIELTEQWIAERDALVEAMDLSITESLTAELEELKEDISRFRDLEVEYAEKEVEMKVKLAEQLDSDINELVEQMDTFIEQKLQAEMAELKESITEVKQNELGRKVFETFAREYRASFVNKSDIENQLAEAEAEKAEIAKALSESEARFESVQRDRQLNELLSPLGGKQRSVMETILKSIPTESLAEGYEMFLPRVLKESKQPAKESAPVLAESEEATNLDESVVITGDSPSAPTETLEESATDPKVGVDLEYVRRLAGISS